MKDLLAEGLASDCASKQARALDTNRGGREQQLQQQLQQPELARWGNGRTGGESGNGGKWKRPAKESSRRREGKVETCGHVEGLEDGSDCHCDAAVVAFGPFAPTEDLRTVLPGNRRHRRRGPVRLGFRVRKVCVYSRVRHALLSRGLHALPFRCAGAGGRAPFPHFRWSLERRSRTDTQYLSLLYSILLDHYSLPTRARGRGGGVATQGGAARRGLDEAAAWRSPRA